MNKDLLLSLFFKLDQLSLLSGWNFVTLLILELRNPLARALLVLLGCYEKYPPIPSVQHPSILPTPQ